MSGYSSASQKISFNLTHYCRMRNIIMTNSQPVMNMLPEVDYKRLGKKLSKNYENPRRASIFIPLCNMNGEASVLFTLRTDKVSTHKGEVSFPGGHIDPGETATQAAIRETEEEMGGWCKDRIVPLGQFGPLWSRAGTEVTPVLGYIKDDVGDLSQFNLSENEVQCAFALPIREILDPKCYEMTHFHPWGMRWNFPEWHSGPAKVWGLTAYALHSMMMRVVVPGCGLEGQAQDMILKSNGMQTYLPDFREVFDKASNGVEVQGGLKAATAKL